MMLFMPLMVFVGLLMTLTLPPLLRWLQAN